jgi:arylformamidase
VFYDLSVTIENGMARYAGDPEPRVARVATGSPWTVHELRLGTHTGTHIDAARHVIAEGAAIDQYPPMRFILPGIVIDASAAGAGEAITWRVIETAAQALPPGGAAVLRTGWDRYWADEGDERRLAHPYLAAEAARGLAAAGATLVGIDVMSVDASSSDLGSPVAHAELLSRDILVVENLAHLDVLTAGRIYHFSFLPLRLGGVDGSPIRAVAWDA